MERVRVDAFELDLANFPVNLFREKFGLFLSNLFLDMDTPGLFFVYIRYFHIAIKSSINFNYLYNSKNVWLQDGKSRQIYWNMATPDTMFYLT